MPHKNDVHVKIAEVKIGHAGDVLKCTLGSCVGILFIWQKQGIFGLAHCLLPQAEAGMPLLGAKYVNQAVPSLISLMKLKKENFEEVEVHVFGGGNMMSQWSKQSLNLIGTLNVKAALDVLKTTGFQIKSMDVEGDEGRQVFFDCDSGQIAVIRLPKAV